MSEEEYHFIDDRNTKLEILRKLMPAEHEVIDKYGIEYLIGYYLSGIRSYLKMRDAKAISMPITEDEELVVRMEKIKKEPI